MKYKPYVIYVCKVNCGSAACKYLVNNQIDYQCSKMEKHPDAFTPQPGAQGDNCRGGNLDTFEKQNIGFIVINDTMEKNSKKIKSMKK